MQNINTNEHYMISKERCSLWIGFDYSQIVLRLSLDRLLKTLFKSDNVVK